MNLCIVSPFPPEISGIGQYGWNIARGLAEQGHFKRLTVLANRSHPTNANPLEALPASVQTHPVWMRDDWRATTDTLRAIHATRPEVVWFNLGFTVFGHSRTANFMGLTLPLLARRTGHRVVVTLHEIFEATSPRALGAHNGWVTTLGARTATQLLLQAHAVCVTLRHYATHLHDHYRADNVYHIPHGAFVTPEFLPPPTPTPPNILMLATFAPYKGLPILLQAFKQVRAAYGDVSLTIVGTDHPRFPGYLSDIRTQVNGTPNIHWLGVLSEDHLRDAFARASVVVLPYVATTGASSVLHRAAAFGRPVVVSDLPDLRAVVNEENLQVDYVPPGEPAVLAQTLVNLLRDPHRRLALARHNFAMMQDLSLERTCARYVALFADVMA